jgi:hypothetical protein
MALFGKQRKVKAGSWNGRLLIDVATDRMAVDTVNGRLFGDNERDLVKKIKFVFGVGKVSFSSRRLFDSSEKR